MKIVDLLPPEDTVSHYGIAIAKDRRDLVRFVNGVLESMHADGSWDELFARLQDDLDGLQPLQQPTPVYRDDAS